MIRHPVATGALALGLLSACGNSDIPQRDDIIAAIERTEFMTDRITSDRISMMRCEQRGKIHECLITYRTSPKRGDGEIGIDKRSNLRVEIERVGPRWRVSRIVMT